MTVFRTATLQTLIIFSAGSERVKKDIFINRLNNMTPLFSDYDDQK